MYSEYNILSNIIIITFQINLVPLTYVFDT